jgi:hypothetical protein
LTFNFLIFRFFFVIIVIICPLFFYYLHHKGSKGRWSEGLVYGGSGPAQKDPAAAAAAATTGRGRSEVQTQIFSSAERLHAHRWLSGSLSAILFE